MQQTQNQPLYWDKHRIPVNFTMILSLGIAGWGLYNFVQGDTPLILILGLAVAAYTWVTGPRHYLIYADSLQIVYGRPRVKVIHFSNIDDIELGSLATPDRLRVRLIKGRRQILLAKDPDAFHDQLSSALNDFRAAYPEYGEPIARAEIDYVSSEAASPEALRGEAGSATSLEAEAADTPSQPDDKADYYADDRADSAGDAGSAASLEAEAADTLSQPAESEAKPQDDTPPSTQPRPLY